MGEDVTAWLYEVSSGDRNRSGPRFMVQRRLEREAYAITPSPRRMLDLDGMNHSRLLRAVQE
jgi:hypothetical protein